MHEPLLGFLAFAIGIVAIAVAPVLAVWLIMQLVKVLGFVLGGGARAIAGLVRHVVRFVHGTIVDSLHIVGHTLTAAVLVPLALGSLAMLRPRSARHYGGALEDELMGALGAVYRVSLGHPVRLLGLGALTDGLERRLPELVAEEPRTGRFTRTARGGSSGRTSRGEALLRGETPTFEGYVVEEELRQGGSGARLFAARPTAAHARTLAERGVDAPGRVVVKAFGLGYGSTMPQIVRESRSLEAAKSLGLIVEHHLDDDAFHYVMPFVPGEGLDIVTRRMHAASRKTDGLDDAQLASALGFARDLCDHLTRFHREGLWHKDIKPGNLMVADDRLQVVDFGLVTPLESALTLTTHGTEYFRDPELVRLALDGKRVKDVDGVKFDLYSAGAVLYSVIENSFPAHGSLSSISKRTPEALRWIVRRAMADIDKRYESAEDLGRDLDVLIAARDPFAVRPADLPSVRGDAPPPRARRASVDAGFSDEAGASGEDVRRFEAFGVAAEVRGLSEARAELHTARERRRAAKAMKHEARAEARAARTESRRQDKLERRRKRRGLLRAFGTLGVFFAIVGGAAMMLPPASVSIATAVETQRVSSRASSRAARTLRQDSAAASAGSTKQAWVFHSSTQDALRRLGDDARVLVALDPSASRAKPEIRSASHAVSAGLRQLGLRPLGIGTDLASEPSDLDIELLSEALHEASRAGASRGRLDERLTEFTLRRDDVDAVLWLEADETTGHLRLRLHGAGARGLQLRDAVDWTDGFPGLPGGPADCGTDVRGDDCDEPCPDAASGSCDTPAASGARYHGSRATSRVHLYGAN